MHQPVENQKQIKFIRMTTGEDVLTEYEEQTGKSVFFNPLKVIYGLTPKQDGMIISLAQWVFDTICEKQVFLINENDILMIGDPTKEMVEYYQEALDRNAGKTRKMKQLPREEMPQDDFEAISEDEMEMIKSVLEGIKDNKRKLH